MDSMKYQIFFVEFLLLLVKRSLSIMPMALIMLCKRLKDVKNIFNIMNFMKYKFVLLNIC